MILLPLLLAFSILALNRGPLYYFDTAGYLAQGSQVFGGSPQRQKPVAAPAVITQQIDDKPSKADDTVVASRAIVYGLILGLFGKAGWLSGVVVMNAVLIWAAVWLSVRAVARTLPVRPFVFETTAAALAAGCLGSLPFYIAFLMPDIFAPVLIIAIATLCATFHTLPRSEVLAGLLLAVLAVLVHPSHLLIAALLLPIGLMLSPALAGRRLLTAVVLIGLVIGAGVAERLAFGFLVERVENKHVSYLPFLTARLIDDGPGLRYLENHCPDATLATCALYDVLAQSEDPNRLDAPNILFSPEPGTGSLKLLRADLQNAVSADQFRFATRVLRYDPMGVSGALLRNIGTQLAYFSISMTVPKPDLLASGTDLGAALPGELQAGRLVTQARGWIVPLTYFHGALYGASLIFVVYLLFRRGAVRGPLRSFALIVLAGIIVNAVVCAGISEPAHRYGARVAFLLPLLAALLFLLGPAPQKTGPDRG